MDRPDPSDMEESVGPWTSGGFNLKEIQRPSRYIDSEVNVIRKTGAEVSIALAFPDAYDVGMSHLGMRILYHVINMLDWAVAERAFHPWLDMEEAMRSACEPLRTLESGTPLGEVDVLGFSLQYEMSYTSVLNMLDLSGIPIHRQERTDADPIVIGGGPCTVNPAPMAAFLDAQLIGDGEDAAVEIIEAVRQAKREGDGKRDSILKALAEIEGVYVPAVHDGTGAVIKRRFIASLEDAPVPLAPIVPYAEIIHDRIAVEVSRGCPMGCRYCQAGMIYRPQRERSPERVLQIASQCVMNTGYSDVAFVSLSAGDYPCLNELIRGFNNRFSGQRVAVSLPSLRVSAVNDELLREIRSVRKTGFTIAPEAATARLRAVINKDFSQEDFERTVDTLFKEGWQNIKMYFMIGLPTETEEDIEAIPHMVSEAIRAAKRHTKRFANISVSVSPFVPKAHTPFQWVGQAPVSYMEEKKLYLMKSMRKIKIKGGDSNMSMLEAAFARGGEDAGRLVEAAWREGSRLDGWTEAFSFEAWQRAMDSSGVDAAALAQREYGIRDALPWDMVDTGISRRFLEKEYERAMKGETSPSCTTSCTACGLGCRAEGEGAVQPEAKPLAPKAAAHTKPGIPRKPIKVRARFSKSGRLAYLGHRELMNHMMRALNRAGVPLEYSQGFHPAPKASFGPPLGVGVAGQSEYFDMEILPELALEDIRERLNECLGNGVRILEISAVPKNAPAVQSFATRYVYDCALPTGTEPEDMKKFVESAEFVVQRKKGPVDIRPLLIEAEVLEAGRVRLTLDDQGEIKVRLDEMTQAVLGLPATGLDITRIALMGRIASGDWATPHEPEAAIKPPKAGKKKQR